MSGASLPCWMAQSLMVYWGRNACVLSGLQNSPHSACKRLLCQQVTHSSKVQLPEYAPLCMQAPAMSAFITCIRLLLAKHRQYSECNSMACQHKSSLWNRCLIMGNFFPRVANFRPYLCTHHLSQASFVGWVAEGRCLLLHPCSTWGQHSRAQCSLKKAQQCLGKKTLQEIL